MLPVYNENDEEIKQVEYNNDLDFWDGNKHTDGTIGRHRGLTQLKNSRRFVMIYGTQWPGEKSSAEIISNRVAVQEILRSGTTELFEKYPELQECREKELLQEK